MPGGEVVVDGEVAGLVHGAQLYLVPLAILLLLVVLLLPVHRALLVGMGP